MIQYLELLRDVRANGVFRPDRTGVGSYGVFGRQIRCDLAKGFPLLTTKKLFTRGIIAELLWFIAGDTNEHTLRDQRVNIWKEWAPESGELGAVYGHLWRRFGAKPKAIKRRTPKLREGVSPTYLGVGNGVGKEAHPMGKTWEGMMARCYDPNSVSYPTYGLAGVTVCDRWLEFAAFAEDAVKLPGGLDKMASLEGGTRYVLDKDKFGDGFSYSPENCAWITDAENQHLREDTLYTVEKGGEQFTFTNVTSFCEEHDATAANFSDLWTGRKNAKMRNGFKLVSTRPLRPGVDQIVKLIQGLKDDPNSRRHLVAGWDPTMIGLMALPPCHCLFQFYTEALTVDERIALLQTADPVRCELASKCPDVAMTETCDVVGIPRYRLSCQLYQRSADIFLGVPYNIASYSLLTMMVAQCVNMVPGELIHTYGDLHAYQNHLEQIYLQLTREPKPLPTMTLNPEVKDIFAFKVEDFTLTGYDPHPAIKGEVAV